MTRYLNISLLSHIPFRLATDDRGRRRTLSAEANEPRVSSSKSVLFLEISSFRPEIRRSRGDRTVGFVLFTPIEQWLCPSRCSISFIILCRECKSHHCKSTNPNHCRLCHLDGRIVLSSCIIRTARVVQISARLAHFHNCGFTLPGDFHSPTPLYFSCGIKKHLKKWFFSSEKRKNKKKFIYFQNCYC